MEKKVYKLYHGGHLMRWAQACVVKNPGGIAWIAGAEGRDPETDEVVEGIEAQTRLCLQKIKARLQEVGSSLDNIVHMQIEVAGQFPNGIEKDPGFLAAEKIISDFFEKETGVRPPPIPGMADYDTYKETGREQPLVIDLFGVTSLAKKEMLIEIGVTAVIP